MYITNKNKIIFDFRMKCLSDDDTDTAKTVATSTWGGLDFVDIFVSQLLFDVEENTFRILTTFDQSHCGDHRFKRRNFDVVWDSQDEIWGDGEEGTSGKKDRLAMLEKTVSDGIVKILTDVDPYVSFLDACLSKFRRDGVITESFQRSYIYEFLFHRLESKRKNLTKIFVQARRRSAFGFQPYEPTVAFNSKWYAKKYAYFLVPRRMGKTYIEITNMALATCFFNVKILYVAHNKTLCDSTRQAVESVLYETKKERSDLIKKINTPNDCTEVVKFDGSSTIVYISGLTDKAIRGQDVEWCVVDESLNIPLSNNATLMAHGTKKDCKITFLSSSCVDKIDSVKRIVFAFAPKRDVINLYRVSFFCMDLNHVQYVKSQSACPRIHMYVPDHVILDTTNADITSVLTNCDKSYDNELGILTKRDLPENAAKDGTVFSPDLIRFLTKDPNALQNVTIDAISEVFFYFDPAINATTSSANALCVVGRTSYDVPVLLYCDEITIEPGVVMLEYSDIVTSMIVDAMNHVHKSLVHSRCLKRKRNDGDGESPSHKGKLRYYLAVEANCQEIVASELYDRVRKFSRANTEKFDAFFYYHAGKPTPSRKPGYWLLRGKSDFYRLAIRHLNQRKLFVSVALGSKYVTDPIRNLVTQLQNFSYDVRKKVYTGKVTKKSRDDLVDALLLSTHLCLVFKDKLRRNYDDNVIAFARNEPWVHGSLISNDGYIRTG